MPWRTLLLEIWNVFIVVPLLDSVNNIFNTSSFVIIADVSEIIFSEGGGGGIVKYFLCSQGWERLMYKQ